MNIQELRKQTKEELEVTLTEKTKEVEEAIQDMLKEKEKNVSKVRFLKKDIARIKTIMKEKEREITNE